jgi:hypothetical protein
MAKSLCTLHVKSIFEHAFIRTQMFKLYIARHVTTDTVALSTLGYIPAEASSIYNVDGFSSYMQRAGHAKLCNCCQLVPFQ